MHELLKSKGNKPRKGKVFKCKICSEEFYVKPSDIKERKTCSRICRNKYQENRNINKCVVCGKEYARPLSQIKWRGSNYCSNRCKWIGIIKRGKDSPNWQGGVSRAYKYGYHSTKYKQWREAVFKRDNWTCCFCGARSKSPDFVYLEAHHMLRFAYHESMRFNINNGFTLCRECHQGTKKIDRLSKLILINQSQAIRK